MQLLDTQMEVKGQGASWPKKRYTGTGFPGFFYLGYTLNRHYFPMVALGRWVNRWVETRTINEMRAGIVERGRPVALLRFIVMNMLARNRKKKLFSRLLRKILRHVQ